MDRKQITCFLILILFCLSFLQGQVISGTTQKSSTEDALPYVNIGVVGKNIGTVSNAKGKYNLDLSAAKPADTLRFSCIGYETQNFSISEIRKKGLPRLNLLKEKTYELEPVSIQAKGLNRVCLGIPKKECYPIPLYKKVKSDLAFPLPGFRHEIGSRFKNSALLLLDSVQINLSEFNADTLFLRLNVYSRSAGKTVNLLKQAIYLQWVKKENNYSPTVDLTELKIRLEQDFIISLDNYKKMPNEAFAVLINTKTIGSQFPTYYRQNSQSNWLNLKNKSKDFGLSIQVYARQVE